MCVVDRKVSSPARPKVKKSSTLHELGVLVEVLGAMWGRVVRLVGHERRTAALSLTEATHAMLIKLKSVKMIPHLLSALSHTLEAVLQVTGREKITFS